ncbi:hypothetical protein K491DRAFT_605654 [Lophiostoma macrostomum CBS 122681]|uniref:Zn(2)-C6 fungal-type domain-containing protein n=1 Tax=Lophiostoma macrostomum CBS 122681 TaxID=1314788 RepID=A0A6A6SWD4_9PLEO|nr:hypothetical protein K491DRAFT_605654 [Lophiostoma macrostomum CBS 122681]
MPTLRKACRQCTSAKARCIIQTPQCKRCALRGLSCTYDLSPLTASCCPPDQPLAPKDTPGHCILRVLKVRGGIDPAICDPGQEKAIEIIRLGYQSIPQKLREGSPALCVHPKLHTHGAYNHTSAFTDHALADTAQNGDGCLGYEGFRRLLGVGFEDMDIYEQLTAVQALIVYIAIFHFPHGPPQEPDSGTALTTLSSWTAHLLSLTSNIHSYPTTSPWQSWLLAESVRRTIIFSYGLIMTLASFNRGYCDGWLFVESLPFDSRPGLWMAMSPQAWIAAAGVKRGEDVVGKGSGSESGCLESYHEYGERVRKGWRGGEGDAHMVYREDMFFMLMAFGHEGWEGHWGV